MIWWGLPAWGWAHWRKKGDISLRTKRIDHIFNHLFQVSANVTLQMRVFYGKLINYTSFSFCALPCPICCFILLCKMDHILTHYIFSYFPLMLISHHYSVKYYNFVVSFQFPWAHSTGFHTFWVECIEWMNIQKRKQRWGNINYIFHVPY